MTESCEIKREDVRSSKYEKVIFLDVDGVLNDNDFERKYRENIYIQEPRVKRLKDIVEATQAKIVMSSSWRHCFKVYNEEPERITSEHDLSIMKELKDKLDKYGLIVSDYTEYLTTGPYARPLEIRKWILDKGNLKRFVILDDDDFWVWNWLSDYFVMTRRKKDDDDDFMGLEDEHVKRAIEILNR